MPREFTYRVDDALKNGLRRNKREVNNAQALESYFQAQASDFGAVKLDTISNTNIITTPSITPAHPFPQLFRNRRRELVVEAATVHRTDVTTPGTGITMTLVQSDDGTTSDTIAGSALWHHAWVGDSWFMTNGSTLVYETAFREGVDLSGGNGIALLKDPTINTVAATAARIFAGGVASGAGAWLTGARFLALFNTWKQYQGLSSASYYVDENLTAEKAIDEVTRQFLFYSTSLGGSKTWPFYYLVGMLGGLTTAAYDKIEPDLLDQVRTGNLGMIPINTQGPIYVAKRLGNDLRVYTGDGIIHVEETQAGFSQGRILGGGVPNRNAVGGDDNEHIMVAQDGALWRFRVGEGAERLGYEEFIQPLTLSSLSIVLQPTKRHYYISDGTDTYLLSGSGLSKVDSFPTGVFINKQTEESIIPGYELAGGDVTFNLTSTPFDMGFNGLKTVTGVQLGIQDFATSGPVTVGFDYRNDTSGAWLSTARVPVNDEGVGYFKITAREFKVVVEADTVNGDGKLEYIDIKWQSSDIRSQRGTRERSP